jgi:hypothetical protein
LWLPVLAFYAGAGARDGPTMIHDLMIHGVYMNRLPDRQQKWDDAWRSAGSEAPYGKPAIGSRQWPVR